MRSPIRAPGPEVIAALASAAGNEAPVLVLGTAAPALAERVRARGVDARIGLPHAFHRDQVRFPTAIAAGLIEYDPWDRWALQRLHRVIAPGGRLLLAAPLRASAATVFEPGYVLAMVAKQMRARLGGRGPAPFRGRKYTPAGLERQLAALGFAILRVSRVGPGHVIFECRRLPSLAGLDPARPYPDPAVAIPAFEREQAAMIAIRDAWVTRFAPGGPGPVRELDPERYRGQNVLVLAPHPDDEIIGCGGTLARLIQAGAHVSQIQATDGSDSAAFANAPEAVRTQARLDEAARVAGILGIAETEYWREDNRAFRHSETMVARLAARIERDKPRLVFVPFVADYHPDHLTLEHILADALERAAGAAAGAEVMNYEVWSMLPANVCCDVTAFMSLEERLLLTYEIALQVDDYVHFTEGHKWYNSRVYLGRDGYADAYHAVPAERYPVWWRASQSRGDV
jgi:LmbE family N-acetylglucosaminyl deacetylase